MDLGFIVLYKHKKKKQHLCFYKNRTMTVAFSCNESQLYVLSIKTVIQHKSSSTRIRAGAVHKQNAV